MNSGTSGNWVVGWIAKAIVMAMLVLAAAACGGGGGGGGAGDGGSGGGGTPQAAVISAQPADRSVSVGTATSFTVTASNATAYQWQQQPLSGTVWTDIAAETAAQYTTPASTLAMNGLQVRVRVTGSDGGALLSSSALLTVTQQLVAPAITTQPQPLGVLSGQAASFSVTATGSQLSYVWQASNDAGITWADLSAPSLPILTLAAVTQADNGRVFRVRIANSVGTVLSTAVGLTVASAPQTPTFVTQPRDVAAVVGQNVSFNVEVAAQPLPSLRWQQSVDGGVTWADIAGSSASGATASSYGLLVSLTQNELRLRVVASNSNGTTNSTAAVLTVSALPAAPSFSRQPTSAAVVPGASVTLQVAAQGTPTPTLQWQTADVGASFANINGATGTSYTTPSLATADSGRRYQVVASNSAGQVTSAVAVVTVGTAPTLQVQIQGAFPSTYVAADLPFTLSATVGGQPAPTLQWYALSGNAPVAIAGATGTTYVAPAVGVGVTRTYSLIATNALGAVERRVQAVGAVAYVSANDQLLDVAVVVGSPVLIQRSLVEVGAGDQPLGLPVPTLQWQTSTDAGVTWADVPGATGYQMAWPATTLADNGRQFRHRATNVAGTAISGVATLRVASEAQGPSLNYYPTTRIAHTEDTDAGTFKGWRWLRLYSWPDGVPTPTLEITTSSDNGATWQTWSDPRRALTAADDGRLFRLTASNSAGTATSLPIRLRLAGHSRSPVEWGAWPGDTEAIEGALAGFAVRPQFAGTADTYQWQVSDDGGATWAPFTAQAGSLNTPLIMQTLPVTLLDHGKRFRFQMTLAGQTYTTGAGRLTVRAAPPARLDLLAGNAGGLGTLDGSALEARFLQPSSITRDANGNVYVIDDQYSDTGRLRHITPQGEVRSLYAEAMGYATAPALRNGNVLISRISLHSVAAAPDGTLFLADATRIWRRAAGAPRFTLLAGGGQGDGTGTAAGFTFISAMAVGPDGALTVAEGGYNVVTNQPQGNTPNCLRRVTPSAVVTTLAGSCATNASAGQQDGAAASARFNAPMGVAVDDNGDIYVADAGNHRLRKLAGGTVTTVTGFVPGLVGGVVIAQVNGPLATASLYAPRAVAMLSPGVAVVSGSGRLRVVQTQADLVSTVGGGSDAGADGGPTQAGFSSPHALCSDGNGGLLVGDGGRPIPGTVSPTGGTNPLRYLEPGNGLVRRMAADRTTSTVAGVRERAGSADGSGAAATFRRPFGLVADAAGNVYVADTGNHTIRRIDRFGLVSTLAGTPGTSGWADGIGASARFNEPRGLALAPDGALWVADAGNHVVRRVATNGAVTTVLGSPGVSGAAEGAAADVRLRFPSALATLPDGRLALADSVALRVWQADGTVRRLSTYGATGPSAAMFGLALAARADGLLFLGSGAGIRSVSSNGTVNTLVGYSQTFRGDGPAGQAGVAWITAMAFDAAGRLWVADGEGQSLRRIEADGRVSTVLGVADFDLTRLSSGAWLVHAGGVRLGTAPRLGYAAGLALLPDGRVAVSSENGVFAATVP